MKYYLIAGEASGDLHASNLMKALIDVDPKAEFRFFGGDLMLKQGGTLVKHYKEMAFMGVIPVVLNLRTILKNMSFCKKDIRMFNPDVVILVDYPGFNLKIAEYVKTKLAIPVNYYISPKIWAWKGHRIKEIRKYIDKMYCILPFEVDFYKQQNYPVSYVGNPSVDAVSSHPHREETSAEFVAANKLTDKPIIAILAGSRKQEIKKNLPTMLRAAGQFKAYQLIIAGAPGIEPSEYSQYIDESGCDVKIIFNQTYRLLQQSTAALVTSGTATLETALFRVPQVVCYHTAFSTLVGGIFKYFFHIKYISLVNLIAEKEIVQELFAQRFSEQNITHELDLLLNNKQYRAEMLAGYDDVIHQIGKPGASVRAAELIYTSLNI